MLRPGMCIYINICCNLLILEGIITESNNGKDNKLKLLNKGGL